MFLYIIIIPVVVFIVFFIYYFNIFITYQNKVKNAWSDIDVQLKRRADMLPNLIELVKQYANYEKNFLENISRSRTEFLKAVSKQQLTDAAVNITGSLKSFFAIVEAYPQLMADQNFLNLQQTLIDIEEQIQLSRRYYNAVVRDYNIKIESFPGNLFAKMLNFKSQKYFEIETLDREQIKVKIVNETNNV